MLDVFIVNFSDINGFVSVEDNKLSNKIHSWCISIINEVFGVNFIYDNCTEQQIKALENKILSLGTSRQLYMIQYLIDCEFSLSNGNCHKEKMVEKLISKFYKYRTILKTYDIDKEDIPSLEEQFKIKIYYSSADYNIKKIRKEKLMKINTI